MFLLCFRFQIGFLLKIYAVIMIRGSCQVRKILWRDPFLNNSSKGCHARGLATQSKGNSYFPLGKVAAFLLSCSYFRRQDVSSTWNCLFPIQCILWSCRVKMAIHHLLLLCPFVLVYLPFGLSQQPNVNIEDVVTWLAVFPLFNLRFHVSIFTNMSSLHDKNSSPF